MAYSWIAVLLDNGTFGLMPSSSVEWFMWDVVSATIKSSVLYRLLKRLTVSLSGSPPPA